MSELPPTPTTMLTLGAATAVQLLRQGRLPPASAWWAVKGAWKYLAAIAAGEVREAGAARECVRACMDCPARTVREIDIQASGIRDQASGSDFKPAVMEAHYCGPAFEDRTRKNVGPTCGCLVAVTVHGEARPVNTGVAVTMMRSREILPAGKTLVEGETCPRGRW